MDRDDGRVYYGIARVDLHLPGLASLKAKRSILRRVEAALQRDLGCSVSEVGAQDRWQRAILGVGIAASSATGVDRVLDRIRSVIERDPRIVVLAMVEVVDHLDADLGADGLDDVPGS